MTCNNCGTAASYCSNCGIKFNDNIDDNNDVYTWHKFATNDGTRTLTIHWDNRKSPSLSTGSFTFWNRGEIGFPGTIISFYSDRSLGYTSRCNLYKSKYSDEYTGSLYTNDEKFKYDDWNLQDQYTVKKVE